MKKFCLCCNYSLLPFKKNPKSPNVDLITGHECHLVQPRRFFLPHRPSEHNMRAQKQSKQQIKRRKRICGRIFAWYILQKIGNANLKRYVEVEHNWRYLYSTHQHKHDKTYILQVFLPECLSQRHVDEESEKEKDRQEETCLAGRIPSFYERNNENV